MQNSVIKHGTVLGIACVALTVIAYLTSLSFMGSFKFIGLILVISIGYAIYAGIDYRNSVGGYITYGQALMFVFLVFVVSGVINTIFGILLYQVIDTGLAERMTEAIIQNTEETMANWGAPQATIDQTIAQMRIDLPEGFTITGSIINFGKALIMDVILALICALFVRRNVPEVI